MEGLRYFKKQIKIHCADLSEECVYRKELLSPPQPGGETRRHRDMAWSVMDATRVSSTAHEDSDMVPHTTQH